jgi:hypothetical protein
MKSISQVQKFKHLEKIDCIARKCNAMAIHSTINEKDK